MLACFMADLSLNCKNLTLQFLQLNIDFRSIRALLYSKKTKTGFGPSVKPLTTQDSYFLLKSQFQFHFKFTL